MSPSNLLGVSTRSRRSLPQVTTESESTRFLETVAWVLGSLEKGSPFFQQNPPRSIPHLEQHEIEVGKILGEGEFGIVCEVSKFNVSEPCHCSACLQDAPPPPSPEELVITGIPIPKTTEAKSHRAESTGSRVSFADVPITISDIEYIHKDDDLLSDNAADDDDDDTMDFEQREERGFMRAHVKRGGLARYAVKRLRKDVPEAMKEDAAIDLATEAKFLASLSHPNIIKLRAIVGTPGHANFLMVMDRLYSTLDKAIVDWRQAEKRYRGFLGHFGRRKQDLDHVRIDRMVALYDIARAMKYLHRHNIIYRDLKPENIGFDVRGDAKLFDLGLAKELLPKDLVSPPDGYEASGMTGSRRYMSPEVVLCKEYGLTADVYSYSMLFWEVMALEIPFKRYDTDQHFLKVVLKGERPKPPSFLSPIVVNLLEDCWNEDRTARPRFNRIVQTLKAEITQIEGTSGEFVDRTTHLMDSSYSSRFGST